VLVVTVVAVLVTDFFGGRLRLLFGTDFFAVFNANESFQLVSVRGRVAFSLIVHKWTQMGRQSYAWCVAGNWQLYLSLQFNEHKVYYAPLISLDLR
jgi:hypothetical protein